MGNNSNTKNNKNLNHKKNISVIIPAFQEEKLIENILKQFTPDIKSKFKLEVIVSDGGSTDNTINIARKNSEIVVENNTSIKQNIAIGRNIGAAKANGDILMFVNADTKIDKIESFLEDVINEFKKENIVGITCPVFVYPEEEKLKDKIFHCFLNIYFFALNVLGIGMGRGECQIVRKKHFDQLGGYNEKIAAGEDFEMFKRLRKLGKIKFFWKHKVFESPRRYRKYGYVKIIFIWLINAISVLIAEKSLHSEWKPIR